ncbi:MAG: CHRD domain-containing protein [Pseudomonadales bacterium]
MFRKLTCFSIVLIALGGCSDSNNNRSAPAPAPAPPPNTTSLVVTLTPAQVIGGGATAGEASADLTLNLDDGELSGIVSFTGLTAEGVTLNRGFAGEMGEVIFTLDSASGGDFEFPPNSVLDAADIDALNAGSLYLEATSAAAADGALRGQLLTGDIQLLTIQLSAAQEVPPVPSAATGVGAVTVDPSDGVTVVHINTEGLDDAVAAHVHQALAGVNGGVLIELSQDPNDSAHWFSEDAVLDADGLTALAAAQLYLNVHSPTFPGGEIRGQIVPDDVELVLTTLSGDDVVPAVASANSGVAASTIVAADQRLNLHVNLVGLDDATSVALHQAPLGQNGPEVLALSQDANQLSHWLLEDALLDTAQYQALRNQGLYVLVSSPTQSNGELRGQLEPVMSSPSPTAAFVIDTVTPADGATENSLPVDVVLGFNRAPLPDTVAVERFTLEASGGDGTFEDGNELLLNIAAANLDGSAITLDLTGASGGDDVYRLIADGSSMTPLTDADGVVLDGDNDGSAGGDFVSSFSVSAPVQVATLSQIQAQVFTPSCAVSGCHSGASPPQGLNLSDGQAFSNLVNVASGEVPTLNLVTPNDADNSYLVQKVEGSAAVGSRMPLGQPALSNALIQDIRDWINDGAQDN